MGTPATLLYDGDCGLCSRSVAWLRRRDPRGRVQALPAGDGPGQAMLRVAGLLGVEKKTVLLFWRGKVYRGSAAVVRTLWAMGRRWKAAAAALWLVPWPLRELGYRLVARYRHLISKACGIGPA